MRGISKLACEALDFLVRIDKNSTSDIAAVCDYLG